MEGGVTSSLVLSFSALRGDLSSHTVWSREAKFRASQSWLSSSDLDLIRRNSLLRCVSLTLI